MEWVFTVSPNLKGIKSMKKLVSFMTMFVLSAFVVGAQTHVSQDVLLVKALATGTNGWGITNFSLLTTNVGMLFNPTNIYYTNLNGNASAYATSLSNVGTTNVYTTVPLFRAISLYTDRNGRPIFTYIPTEAANGLLTNSSIVSAQTLFIAYSNPQGSNAPFGVVFRPSYDGVTPSANASEDWGVRIAGLAAASGTIATNIPTWRWPGAKSLVVVAVTNQFIKAGPSAVTNSTMITAMSVNGFIP